MKKWPSEIQVDGRNDQKKQRAEDKQSDSGKYEVEQPLERPLWPVSDLSAPSNQRLPLVEGPPPP